MARIYRRTDRIAVKIDDVTVKLSPMSLHQKTEVQSAMLKGHKATDIREATRGIALAIQYSVKGIEGVEDSDGNPYKLQFNETGEELTEACVDDLMNVELSRKLALVCASMVNGIPSEFTDQYNQALEGVQIVESEKAQSQKKT